MKRRTQLIGVLSLALVAGGGIAGYQWWQAGEIRQLAMSRRPALPPLAAATRELVERITEADRRLQSGR